jgi:hypothetical protein
MQLIVEKRGYRLLPLLALALAAALLVITARDSSAVHDTGLFELDRNATDEGGGGDDWGTLYAGGGSAADFTGIIEDTMGTNPFGTVGTQFQAGGSKDDLDISPGGATGQNWKWEPGEPLDKDDITNAYAAAYANTVDTGDNNIGDLIIFFGLDRYANNGSAQVGFWFVQDPNFGLTTTPSGGGYLFSGHHMVGDVLVQSNFTQGGIIETISVYEWVGSGGSEGTLNLVFSAQDCLSPGLSDDAACATVNRGDTPSPWPFTPKFGTPGTFPQGSFFEGGINITRLIPDAGCFTGFLAETRSSTPFDSRLKDFALGDFDLCSIDVTKTGDTLSKVGDDVDYSITIENTGALTLYKDDISDTLLGDLTADAGCGDSLAPGATCTIAVSRTVQAGDPDPLPNTVTAVYNNRDDFSGTAVSDSDSHSVNLFQPAIAVAKTGPQYSKLGDDVNYTLTLNNTSSGDTPDLECTITDAMLGINKPVTLASGASDVTNATYTVQAGDPDPLDNTASVSCSPIGFSNVLTASDGHSVDLIHPSFTVAKTCDAEPISYLGPANFTVTIANTGDVPLNITADDGIGAFALDAGASQSFPVSVPGPFTPGGTADNTVTASWTLPELYGLSNTDAKSASDSCDVLQPVFETAYAMGDAAVCFTDLGASNWGWVNGDGTAYILPGEYTWPVWAGAAQCDTNKGTLVGTVTVNYDGTDVFVTFNIGPPYMLGDTHVYAGYDQVPPGGFSPGQYQIYSPFDGTAIYIIVHAVVGMSQ